MRLVVLAVVLATILPFSAQAQQRTNADVYRISPEDILRIAVWKNEAMSDGQRRVRVGAVGQRVVRHEPGSWAVGGSSLCHTV